MKSEQMAMSQTGVMSAFTVKDTEAEDFGSVLREGGGNISGEEKCSVLNLE